jgi:hypothetical protein
MKEITEMFRAMFELHAITLIRMKCVILALEQKNVLTRAEIDAIQENLSDTEYNADLEKVRDQLRLLYQADKT